MKGTQRIENAKELVLKLHQGQVRKADGSPYFFHPYSVADMLSGYTGDEDIIIAGLLHDVLEDVPGYDYDDMERNFGKRIAGIVSEVSEEKDPDDTKEKNEATWESRKRKYLEHLEHASYEALMVSAADKYHNLFSLYIAYKAQGEGLWSKFNASPEKTLWFYESVIKVLQERLDSKIVKDLTDIYTEIRNSVFKDIKPYYPPAEAETLKNIVYKTCFPLNPELNPDYKGEEDPLKLSKPFIAFVLDGIKPYKIYLVNPTYRNYVWVEALTGAFFSTDEKMVSTSIVKKPSGTLPPKSYMLVEEDEFNQLDYQIWFHIDLYPQGDINNPEKLSFDLPRYGLGYKEKKVKMPIIEECEGMYLTLFERTKGQVIDEEMKHMNLKGGYM
ncbi:MAG: HD domain-containing protein [Armatimonadota bacterium]